MFVSNCWFLGNRLTPSRIVNKASKNTSDFDTESLRDLNVGMQVQHDRFGSGKVVSMDGDFPNNKATIFFDGIGQKQLLIKFAKLRIVE